MNYKIKADGESWTTYEMRTAGDRAAKPGTETEKAIAFHGNLRQSAESMLDRLIRDKAPEVDIDNTAELKAVIVSAVAEVREIVAQAVRGVPDSLQGEIIGGG